MENIHGYKYDRVKKPRKNFKKLSPHPTPQSPSTGTPLPGSVDIPTPVSGPASSPSQTKTSPSETNTQSDLIENQDQKNQVAEIPSVDHDSFPELAQNSGMLDGISPIPQPLDFNTFYMGLQSSDPNEYLSPAEMNLPQLDLGSVAQPGFESGMSDNLLEDLSATTPNLDFDWDMNNDYTVMDMHQLLTPSSLDTSSLEIYSRCHSVRTSSSPVPEQKKITTLSPGGQGNLMLYSPDSHDVEDEGFHENHGPARKLSHDFTLYDSTTDSVMGSSNQGNQLDGMGSSDHMSSENTMFPPLNTYNEDQHSGPQCFDPRNGVMNIDDIF